MDGWASERGKELVMTDDVWDLLTSDAITEEDEREELRRMCRVRDMNTTQKKIVADWEYDVLEAANEDMSKYTTTKRIAKNAGVHHISDVMPRVLDQINYAYEKARKDEE